VTVTMLDATPAQADPGRVTEANPTRPDPEVPERAHRRTFTARYKLDVLAAYDAANPGEKGAILRREGLYSSHVVDWRQARDAGVLQPRRGLATSPGRQDRPALPGAGPTGAGAGQGRFVVTVQDKKEAVTRRPAMSVPVRGRGCTLALGLGLCGRGCKALGPVVQLTADGCAPFNTPVT
jgi:hypothetical protein